MHILSCRHANQEEKSEIRNRLEGLKKGKHPMAVFSSTPTHTVQNEDRTQSPVVTYQFFLRSQSIRRPNRANCCVEAATGNVARARPLLVCERKSQGWRSHDAVVPAVALAKNG